MKVLMVVHQFPPQYMTGTELYAMDLALNLVAAGHSVSILSAAAHWGHHPDYHEWTEAYRGLDVHYVQATRPLFPNRVLAEYYRPFLAKRLVELLERERFDVVHFFHFLHLGVSLVEETWARGVPCVVNLMDFWTICPRITLLKPSHEICGGPDSIPECLRCMRDVEWSGYDMLGVAIDDGILTEADLSRAVPAERLLPNDSSLAAQTAAARARAGTIRKSLSRASAIISPSRFLRSMLVKNGWREDSMRVLGYAVAEALAPASDGPPAGAMRFGYMGSLVPHKGPHVLVEAFRKLAWPQATLTMYGDPRTDREHTIRLRELADGDPRIRFAGPYARHEIRRVHSEIDVLVAPSVWYENTPFVMLEAQAAGIPVVASRLGGLAEIVEDGKSGFLFEAGDADDLAKVLARFRDDPALWSKLRRGVPPVKRMNEHIRELVALYEEICAHTPVS
jgi:glycosyltransferase involved in cell wall biosynthesis